MNTSLLPHARNRRLAAAVTGVIGAALLPALMFTSGPAAATSPCVPAGYTAHAAADLLKLNLLDVGPLGLLPGSDRERDDRPRHRRHGARAPADRHGERRLSRCDDRRDHRPDALLNAHASQTAPPAHAAPDSHSLVALHNGLLSLGVGNVAAQAGQSGPYGCGLATGAASVLDAAAVTDAHGHSLVALPTNLNGKAGAGLTTVGGHLGSEGGAAAGLADVELFGGTSAAVAIKVITEPTLIAIAAGTAATSSVTYTSPVLDVTLPGGKHVRLSDTGGSVSFGVSAALSSIVGVLPEISLKKVQLQVRLSLGALTKSVTPTSVSGSAATVRLQVMLAPLGAPLGMLSNLTTGGRTVIDLGIGELSAAATAPPAVDTTPAPCDGNYGCPGSPSPCTRGYGTCTTPSPPPSPSTSSGHGGSTPGHPTSPKPSTSVAGATSGNLPLTGSGTPYFVGGGVLLLLVGRLLLVIARRRTSTV